MTEHLPVQMHRRDCAHIDTDGIVGCGCPVYTDEQPMFDVDVVALGGGGDDPLRWYLANATRVRPIRWYEDQAQAVTTWGLPKWVDKPEWPGSPDDPAYVVFRRMKVWQEVCPRPQWSGHKHCERLHTEQEHYGLIPLRAFPSQLDAVEWARTDLAEQSA